MNEAPSWRIHLLGGFRVAFGSNPVPDDAWGRRKAATLIKLLALAHGHCLPREQVMETLWPDHTPAAQANSLYQLLHTTRGALGSVEAQGVRGLRFEGERLCLEFEAPLWIDAEAFDAAALAARRSGDPAAYQAALALYAGDLLPADIYEEWTDARRTDLRATYLMLLTGLAGLQEARAEHAGAIETLRRVLAADPAHEATHRSLMRLYYLVGERQQALRQYQALREALQRDVEAEPDTASQALYREIVAARVAADATGKVTQHSQPASVDPFAPGPTDARPVEPPRQNLPHALSSFIGRERERAEVRRLLGSTRLLTLTGPGGSGKTRLALEVARAALESYSAGAWFVDLAALTEPSLLPRTVAAALGAPETTDRPVTEGLASYIGRKRLLLVLDNCEHLIDACAELAEALLTACPNLHILATSREYLRVPGEVPCPVPPLALPTPQQLPPWGELAGYEAVRLFCERAAAVLPGFRLTPENATAVAEICLRLDGLPLAIELAAARSRVLAPGEILAGLENRYTLLTGGARTAPARQKTLRGAIDWSYDLLTGPEQELFRRLAVFQGGFNLAAAETVCEGSLGVLAQLVDKSLVVADTQGAQARYAMLETIQEYAEEKVAAQGETAWLHHRHLQFYLAWSEEAEPRIHSRDRKPWLELLDREAGNLRAALSWAERGPGPADAGLRMATALTWFWADGHVEEGRHWLAKTLAVMPAGSVSNLVRARALGAAGLVGSYVGGDRTTAREMLIESVALARSAGAAGRRTLAQALADLVDVWQGEHQAALGFGDEAVALAREDGEPWHLAYMLWQVGFSRTARGDMDSAQPYLAESLDLFRKLEDAWGVSWVLTILSRVALSRGEYATARSYLENGVAVNRQSGDSWALGFALGYLGEVAFAQGAYEEDAALLDECIELFRDLGIMTPFACCVCHRGMVAERLGDYASAESYLREGLIHLRRLDFVLGMLGGLAGFACLALALGQVPRAACLLGAVTAICQAQEVSWVPFMAAELAYTRALDIVRPALAQPECAAAWERGQAMELAEAVALALDEPML